MEQTFFICDGGSIALPFVGARRSGRAQGPPKARDHRKVHLHVFGRSRKAKDPDWRWGEAPKFPDFIDSKTWSAKFERLRREECEAIGARVETLLTGKYGMHAGQIVAKKA